MQVAVIWYLNKWMIIFLHPLIIASNTIHVWYQRSQEYWQIYQQFDIWQRKRAASNLERENGKQENTPRYYCKCQMCPFFQSKTVQEIYIAFILWSLNFAVMQNLAVLDLIVIETLALSKLLQPLMHCLECLIILVPSYN